MQEILASSILPETRKRLFQLVVSTLTSKKGVCKWLNYSEGENVFEVA